MKRFLFNLKANNAHGLHSPLVYELYTKVINPTLHKSGNISINLAAALSNYRIKSLIKNEFNVKIIDVNQLNMENIVFNYEDVLLIKNIRYPKNISLWQSLIKNKKIIFSIELFEIGILFFTPIAPKMHFIFKKSRLK